MTKMGVLGDSQSLQQSLELFYRGNHADLVSSTIDAYPSCVPAGTEAVLIGSLGNLGRLNEAKHLFERRKADLSLPDRVAARYHLGVAYTRHSLYAEGVACFTENLRLARQSKDPILKFYAFMGLGFYRFFCAKFVRCIRAAEIANLNALDAEFTYGKYITFELLGHAKVNVGLVSEGIADIRQAERLASSLGNGSMVESFRIARACYEAQFGIGGSEAFAKLTELYKATPPQNAYSSATLLLEMSRVAALRGTVSVAQTYLNQASRIIYETRHRRYGAHLNFRYAYHAYLGGKFEESLNFLRASENSVHKGIDRFMTLKILDLEQRVRKQMGLRGEKDQTISKSINELMRGIGSSVAERILDRQAVRRNQRTRPGEDPIGDLLDNRDEEKSVPSLLAEGYLTPLRDRLEIPFGKRLILLNVSKDCSLIVDLADIRAISGLSKQLQKLLVVVSFGETSKEKLISDVWGYRHYDQLRHDGVLFQAITRLRHLFGAQREWILNTEHGYKLREGVAVKNHAPTWTFDAIADEARIQESDTPVRVSETHPRLEVAKLRFKNREFTTKDYIDAVNVSKATACRDLNDFVLSNSIKKLVNGKKIKYIIL
jgi:tetratricopeptide (TPR) repeat protein/DNA-binding winged helix-turn-helix (wHTH) protein